MQIVENPIENKRMFRVETGERNCPSVIVWVACDLTEAVSTSDVESFVRGQGYNVKCSSVFLTVGNVR